MCATLSSHWVQSVISRKGAPRPLRIAYAFSRFAFGNQVTDPFCLRVSPMNLLPPMLPSYGVLTTCFRQCFQGSSATFRIFSGFMRFKYADTLPINFSRIRFSECNFALGLVHLSKQDTQHPTANDFCSDPKRQLSFFGAPLSGSVCVCVTLCF